MEFVVVHNGMISNYLDLRRFIASESTIPDTPTSADPSLVIESGPGPAQFVSETDTEVIVKLALLMYQKLSRETGEKPSFTSVVRATLKQVEGTFGMVFKSSLYPNECIACRRSSPLWLGIKCGEESSTEQALRSIAVARRECELVVHNGPRQWELFIASDPKAFQPATQHAIALEDWDIVHISPAGIDILNTNEEAIGDRAVETLETRDVSKGQFPHFMSKEIFEQPESLRTTLRGRATETGIYLGGIVPALPVIKRANYIMMFGVGTSYNIAVAVRPLFEQYLNQRLYVENCCDFLDRKPVIFRNDICIFISQSGTTGDTVSALKFCKAAGALCIGVCNTPGSLLGRLTDCGIYLNAGIENATVSTKFYSSGIAALVMFLLLLMQDTVSYQEVVKAAIADLLALPDHVKTALELREQVVELAKKVAREKTAIVLGRRTHFGTTRETAQKINELAYVHCEGLMAGELKHGPLALIDQNAFVIFIAPGEDKEMVDACLSSLQQVKARGAKILVVASPEEVDQVKAFSDEMIVVPKTSQWTQMVVNIVPMQLLAYYTALEKGINVDQPRNLRRCFSDF
jgi:glucosamine--fructose-6-phosphate aminotransferase (isomerizing)